MSKKIIQINTEKCIGCGLCANTCHQSAIEIINGKATVVRDTFCDGLGRCLPVCPVSAISFSDKDIVNKSINIIPLNNKPTSFQCPSSQTKIIPKLNETVANKEVTPIPSQLNQWPIQIKLVPINAPYFTNADLLISADCSAFAYGNFHNEFMKNKVTIIGCPKLDDGDYSEKLTSIISENTIQSITVVRMEVPCCGGIENAVRSALKLSGKNIPLQVTTISVNGNIL